MTQEHTLQLGRVGHIMLGVRDLARSLAFYRDVLGLTVQGTGGGFAFLDGGSITLALSEPLAGASEHLAGAVEVVFAVDDIHVAHSALSERGVSFHQTPRRITDTGWAANFTDPDGHQLSIFGPAGAPNEATQR